MTKSIFREIMFQDKLSGIEQEIHSEELDKFDEKISRCENNLQAMLSAEQWRAFINYESEYSAKIAVKIDECCMKAFQIGFLFCLELTEYYKS